MSRPPSVNTIKIFTHESSRNILPEVAVSKDGRAFQRRWHDCLRAFHLRRTPAFCRHVHASSACSRTASVYELGGGAAGDKASKPTAGGACGCNELQIGVSQARWRRLKKSVHLRLSVACVRILVWDFFLFRLRRLVHVRHSSWRTVPRHERPFEPPNEPPVYRAGWQWCCCYQHIDDDDDISKKLTIRYHDGCLRDKCHHSLFNDCSPVKVHGL